MYLVIKYIEYRNKLRYITIVVDIVNNVNDTNVFLTFREKAKALAGNGNGISAIDPIGTRLSIGWQGLSPAPLSRPRRIRVSSHIDASALFNCSSDTRSDDTLARGSNMFFRFCSFPGRILGILRDSGRARCLVYTTTRITAV